MTSRPQRPSRPITARSTSGSDHMTQWRRTSQVVGVLDQLLGGKASCPGELKVVKRKNDWCKFHLSSCGSSKGCSSAWARQEGLGELRARGSGRVLMHLGSLFKRSYQVSMIRKFQMDPLPSTPLHLPGPFFPLLLVSFISVHALCCSVSVALSLTSLWKSNTDWTT